MRVEGAIINGEPVIVFDAEADGPVGPVAEAFFGLDRDAPAMRLSDIPRPRRPLRARLRVSIEAAIAAFREEWEG